MENKKILYFEAPDGISGDMVLGALIDLGVDAGQIKNELDKIVPCRYEFKPRPFERNGIRGINLEVTAYDFSDEEPEDHTLGDLVHQFDFAEEPEGDQDEFGLGDLVHEYNFSGGKTAGHVHRSYLDIKKMISDSDLSETAKAFAQEIFRVIAEAEASVHNVKTDNVQFHEVGAMDSIIDVVGTAIAIDLLGISEFYTAAPRDGSGIIISRHGFIPVSVPAVVEMAKDCDIPIVIESDVRTEMITPTGYGILKGLKAKFEPRLGLKPEKTGYGFGKRDTKRLAAVRLTLGELYEELE